MIKDFFDDLGKKAVQLYEHVTYHKNVLNPKIIENGWFPSSITIRHKHELNETIDEFMEKCITGEYYDQIKYDLIMDRYPNRKEIFQEAFRLFEDENYIACIPLLLSQVDGIIMDSGLKGFFLGHTKIKKGLTKDDLKYLEYLKIYMVESGHVQPEDKVRAWVLSLYSSVIDSANKLSISKESSQIDAKNVGYFNRHAILHGNIDYINYGTKINALKSISLLIFIIQTLDIINKNKSSVA